MRKNLLFLLTLSFLVACSTQKKAATPSQTAKSERVPQRISSSTVLKDIPATPAILSLKNQYLVKDSSTVKVFMEMEVSNLPAENAFEKFRESFNINWLLVPDFGVKDRLASGHAEVSKENFSQKDNKFIITFEIPRVKNKQKSLLLTEITEQTTDKKATNDLVIDFNGSHLNQRFGIYTQDVSTPISRNYVTVNDTFQLKSLNNLPKDFFLIHYDYEFDAAAAPMSTTNRSSGAKTLKVDDISKISSNTPINLSKEGLYLIAEDTVNTQSGFGILVGDERFPRFTRPEKLTKPLLYMSTNQEIQILKANQDTKQALDLYFLTMAGGNQATAKRTIKAYYDRVEEANKLFTTYKEGWKTDKGMIYIVLGSPNRIQRGKDREVWVYNQGGNLTVGSPSEILFTFYRKPNQFTENHYELLRYPEYQAYWYPFVEAWRTGNITE